MSENYINYLEGYPNLERALKEGAIMHCFLSGGGLRVVIVKNGEQEITYGEYPYFSGALAHAEEDFGLTYEQLYSGENSKHIHYLSGAYPLPYDAFDVYLKSGNSFDVFYSKKWKEFICTTPPPDKLHHENGILWGSSTGLLAAITSCILSFNFKDKDLFMSEV